MKYTVSRMDTTSIGQEVNSLNKPLIRSMLAKHGDNYGTLSTLLGLPQSGVSNRINGKVDFRLSEINCIRKRYKLTAEETVDIFFDQAVSHEDTI